MNRIEKLHGPVASANLARIGLLKRDVEGGEFAWLAPPGKWPTLAD